HAAPQRARGLCGVKLDSRRYGSGSETMPQDRSDQGCERQRRQSCGVNRFQDRRDHYQEGARTGRIRRSHQKGVCSMTPLTISLPVGNKDEIAASRAVLTALANAFALLVGEAEAPVVG